MGDRGNVILKTDGEATLYLYTHWRGSDLPQIIASALNRGKSCWDDPIYLPRIIFCEMVKGNEMTETGFGISTYQGDGGTDITVDLSKQTVAGVPFAEYVTRFGGAS